MATDTEVAWAAGLFEGEGCFVARRAHQRDWRAMLEMTISMTDKDVLDRFHNIVGAGSVRANNRPGAPAHWKPIYVWRISGEHALRVASLLEPHLCSRRTARLHQIRDLIASTNPVPRSCECCANVFMPTRFARERFCSERCRYRSKYLRRRYGTTHDFLEGQLNLQGAIPGTNPDQALRGEPA